MSSKFEVIKSENGGCYLCQENNQELYLAREIGSGRLTALCGCCLLEKLDSYLIDNTRTWPIQCKRRS